jgi:uncharacterized protein
MRIWFDISHLAQYNFYRKSIVNLAKSNKVFITILNRGVLPKVVRREIGNLDNIEISVVGMHRGNRLSAILESNILRIIKLFMWIINKKIDISLSNGYQASFLGFFFKYPSYTFGDDPDAHGFLLKKWFSTISHYCIYEKPENKDYERSIVILRTLKEWAYLSTKYFHSNIDVLNNYNVQPYNYLFLREAITGTTNYKGQQEQMILGIANAIPKDVSVILSLENKSSRDRYPASWTILEEPVTNIHSLIYYSRGMISSGDSMAREASLLGVDSFYLGIRNMPANRVTKKISRLKSNIETNVNSWLQELLLKAEEEIKLNQINTRKRIDESFIDIVEYIEKLTINK